MTDMAPPRKIKTWCVVDGCDSWQKHGDFCGKHYKRNWRHGNPTTSLLCMEQGTVCSVEGCESVPSKRKLCAMHYARWKRNGHTDLTRNANGSGGVNSDGYRCVSVDGVRHYEHILIAEKALGKPLPPGAVVHHVTEWKDDNHGPFKLVICPNQAYHLLIHQLMREKGISFRYGWPNEEVA